MKANMILGGKILTLFMLCVCLSACSKGISNPITGSTQFETSGPGNLDKLPIIAFDGETAIGVMGGYNLTISNDGKNAELVPMRTSAIGEAYIVSGTSFFTMTPCNDCLKIDKIALDINQNIVLSMLVKHPFPKGDVSKPPSATNRLDLDLFDLALVVKPLNIDPDHYSLTDAYVYAGIVRNTDGYTNELAGVTGENSILPYKICYESANHNRFEMGTGFQPFDVVFSPGERLTFDLYLTMAYGASAKKLQRLNPTYYVPEFNRKPPWKIQVEPVTWNGILASTITINIYDWNHGASISSNYPDPAHLDYIAASSNVLSVTVEVPGMTNSIITAEATDTTTNGWDDPLTYTASFTNENTLVEGIHKGLVKVVDSRAPGDAIHAEVEDGKTKIEPYKLNEFATYQTFDAVVLGSGFYFDDELEDYNEPAFPGVVSQVAARQLLIYFEEGKYDEIVDLINNSNSYLIGQILDMDMVQVRVADGIDLVSEQIYFESSSSVIFARPNYLLDLLFYPDGEPDWDYESPNSKRYHFDITKTTDAWTITTGNEKIKVAVLDTGLDYDNFDDFAKYGRKDGRIIKPLGDLFIKDNNGHGTHVAGIIGASGHNHDGTLGMAWNIMLYPYKTEYFGLNFGTHIYSGVFAAWHDGCQIVNCSEGKDIPSEITDKTERQRWLAETRLKLLPAYAFCKATNILFIQAAMNDWKNNINIDFHDDLPMGHYNMLGSWIVEFADMTAFESEYPNVLFIAATDQNDKYDSGSNRGDVEKLAAPGTLIWSGWSTDANPLLKAQYASGTSMAAPMVSGLAALILSVNPNLTPQKVIDIMYEKADSLPLDPPVRRINAYEAVLETKGQNPGDGNLIWAKRAGGLSSDWGYGITTLSDNSTVVTGSFGDYVVGGSVTFGPGEPNQTLLTSAGELDFFIARYNPDGTLAWAKRAGGSNQEEGYGITTLSDNSTVVTGGFGFSDGGSSTFGPGEYNQRILTSSGGADIFIARYNPNGTLAWAKRAGGTYNDGGIAIATLSDNSTVVTGNFSGSSTFGPGESNQRILTSSGGADIFIARYNPNGTLAWAKRAGGVYDDYGDRIITTLSDNSIVVAGDFYDSTTFGPGEPNQKVLISAGHYDIFIARYNPNGTLVWAKRAGGSDFDYCSGITTLSDNSTVVTGGFNGSATFGPSETNQTVLFTSGAVDIFIARYNPNGTLAWAKRAGGIVYDYGSGITTLSDNSPVVTGYFTGSAIFGPGEINQTVLTSDGVSYDIFIARYNPNGTLGWAKRAGGVYMNFSYGITTLSDNSTVVTGGFDLSATFGPGEPNETFLYSAGGADIFIARFAP